MDANPRYWFPAKRYGWGWGPPTGWQGWTVTIAWVAFVTIGAALTAPRSWLAFAGFMTLAVGVIVAVCYAKGEPPRWRWDER